MKKILIYTFVISMLAFASCGDEFLDSKPVTSLTDGNFYQTKDDAELAIVGCYAGLQELYSRGVSFPLLSEVLSDNCFGATGSNDGLGIQVLDEFDLSRSPGDVDLLNDNWEDYYQGIFRVNTLLLKLDQINWNGDLEYRKSIESQARFLRAYFYFDMVRIWERVPFLTEPDDGNIPQSEPNEIYAQIAEDLVFVAENGDSEISPGRVNKWAAKSLLGRVFLFYTGYYNQTSLPSVSGNITKEQVLTGLEEVINSSNYALIGDNDGEAYKDLWPAASTVVEGEGDNATLVSTYVGKDNEETVFAIKYNITSDWDGNGDGNHWMIMLGLRNQTSSPYGNGWGACTVSPEFYNSFETDDTRREASIIAIDEEGVEFDNADQREYTGYTTKKYTTMANPDGQNLAEANNAVSFMTGQYQDYVVIRYADVLLMAAELGGAGAQGYFDQVRTRSGLTSKAVNFDNIMEERRFEFAFEGLRYWDLLRQGVDVAANTIATQENVLNGGVSTTKTISAGNITKTKGFQMIPQQQITRSGGLLTQNAGWQ